MALIIPQVTSVITLLREQRGVFSCTELKYSFGYNQHMLGWNRYSKFC
jgi:hypothetical protein